MKTRLWILRPIGCEGDTWEPPAGSPWSPWYDKAFGFVIEAPDEQTARELAQTNGGDETRECGSVAAWTDPALSSCVPLKPTGHTRVVMQDFYSA